MVLLLDIGTPYYYNANPTKGQPSTQIVRVLTSNKERTKHGNERQVGFYLHHVSCLFLQLLVALKYLQYQIKQLL